MNPDEGMRLGITGYPYMNNFNTGSGVFRPLPMVLHAATDGVGKREMKSHYDFFAERGKRNDHNYALFLRQPSRNAVLMA